RALADVVREVEALARDGVQEVVLVSQDTLAYGKDLPGPDRPDFGDLVLALSETTVPWLRFLYLHPAHVTEALIAKLARARVLPYLDMPIQHADDGMLRALRRQTALCGTVQEVLVDGPSQDPAFLWEGRTAAQAPEIDGVVYLGNARGLRRGVRPGGREAAVSPGARLSVEIVEVDGYDLVGAVAVA